MFLQILAEATRFNEKALKEARLEEECELFRQRTGRLEKWREAARAALTKQGSAVDLPDAIQFLGCEGAIGHVCIVGHVWKTALKCVKLIVP